MQRYFSNNKTNNYLDLKNDDKYHIKTVMRMINDDQIEVVYQEELYLCCIEIVNNDVNARVIKKLPKKDGCLIETVLIVPLLKEAKMDLILQKATELGVSKIIPINMERCVVKIADNFEKKLDRWNRIVKEASEQSKRTTIPVITNLMNIVDLNGLEGLKIVCSTKEDKQNIKNVLKKINNYGRIYIVFGPEGGITSNEESKLNNLGFVSTTLGHQILRTETVPLFVLSIINYECME